MFVDCIMYVTFVILLDVLLWIISILFKILKKVYESVKKLKRQEVLKRLLWSIFYIFLRVVQIRTYISEIKL